MTGERLTFFHRCLSGGRAGVGIEAAPLCLVYLHKQHVSLLAICIDLDLLYLSSFWEVYLYVYVYV